MRPKRSNPTNRGATLIEVAVALVILAAAMLALAQMVALAARQRRLTEARRLAMEEVANQAERVAALPWDKVQPGEFTGWEPSAGLAAAIPAAECKANVTAEPGPPAARRVRLEIHWTDTAGQAAPPVGLTLWKFEGGQP
jgi:Tfp pilus assembly protein PilV